VTGLGASRSCGAAAGDQQQTCTQSVGPELSAERAPALCCGFPEVVLGAMMRYPLSSKPTVQRAWPSAEILL